MSSEPELDALSDDALENAYGWSEGTTLRLSMLIGAGGTSVGPDGTSHSLSSASDRRVLRAVRRYADAIIVGGASVRSEGWFLPQSGPLIVLSSTANLPWSACPAPDRVIVFRSIEDITTHIGEHPGRYLCDGGITTARQLEDARGFDEIALTSFDPPAEALAELIPHPASYDLAHTFSTRRPSGQLEVFSFWRRAERTKA